MISVTVGSTTNRSKKSYEPDTTLRKILDDNNVDYSTAQVMLDGANIQAGGLDKSLRDYNIIEKCMLIAVVKASNAK